MVGSIGATSARGLENNDFCGCTAHLPKVPELRLYAVRNSDGKWFRSRGYGGYGDTWVEPLEKAKIYTKLGQARARVTFFANNYPEFPAPEIVELVVKQSRVLRESERLADVKLKKRSQQQDEKKLMRNQNLLPPRQCLKKRRKESRG